MCPSSGETTVSMRHLVLVILKQVSHKHSCVSWWWAHSRPKHVEIDKYTKNKLCTELSLFTRFAHSLNIWLTSLFRSYSQNVRLSVSCHFSTQDEISSAMGPRCDEGQTGSRTLSSNHERAVVEGPAGRSWPESVGAWPLCSDAEAAVCEQLHRHKEAATESQ